MRNFFQQVNHEDDVERRKEEQAAFSPFFSKFVSKMVFNGFKNLILVVFVP